MYLHCWNSNAETSPTWTSLFF